jgi:DNA-binding transcriptional regulator YiaG
MSIITVNTIAERVSAIQERHKMTDEQCAEYLGVPIHTLRNWRTGKRIPAAVVYKLLDVLGMIEALAPSLHGALIPDKG